MHPTHGEPRYLLADVTGRLTGPHEDRDLSPASAIGEASGQNDLVCREGVVPRVSFCRWWNIASLTMSAVSTTLRAHDSTHRAPFRSRG